MLTVPWASHASRLALHLQPACRAHLHWTLRCARASRAFPWLPRPAPSLSLPGTHQLARRNDRITDVRACERASKHVEEGFRTCPWGCPWPRRGLLAEGEAQNPALLHQNTGQTQRTPSRTNFREVCPLVLMQPSGRKLAISAWIFWQVAHSFAFYTNDIALFQYCFPFPVPDFRLLKADCSCRGPLLLLEDKSKGLPY